MQRSRLDEMIKDAAEAFAEMILPNAKSARRIAEHPTTPATVLWQLAWHPDSGVREAVVDNPNTNVQTLWLLANDSNPDVRFALAENHNIPYRVLSSLCTDENPYVSSRAYKTLDKLSDASRRSPFIEKLANMCHLSVLVN